jgi:predicted 3-demethylubiquinone-9 3-methyltransferase (glyoxalase superfamily)
MPTISTFLMFERDAEAAVAFYKSIFPQFTTLGPLEFEIGGQRFGAYSGGSYFKFSEAMSIMVSCEDQAEIDRYYNALLADGGKESQCGWLTDMFGVSWQIVPKNIRALMSTKAGFDAVMKMKKLDIATIEKAVASGH